MPTTPLRRRCEYCREHLAAHHEGSLHPQCEVPFEADFVGFECPDHFVVGYGMDVGHAFRELPFVGIVAGDA